jgi:hypothetical protein
MQEFGKETALGELQCVRTTNWEKLWTAEVAEKYAEDRRGSRRLQKHPQSSRLRESARSAVRLAQKKIVIIVFSRRVALSSRG